MECKHRLRLLSPSEIDISVSLLNSSGYIFPPIFQCELCSKVFKTGWNENSLVEILIDELSDEERKKRLENKNNEQTMKSFNFWWAVLAFSCGLFLILLVVVLLFGG